MSMKLAKPNLEDDAYTYVDVQVKDLHTFAEIEGDHGGAFHVVPEAVLPESRWRQVFMFHDNRFSHNRTMLYHVANTLMRHAVNKAVSVTMRTKC